MTDAVTDAVTDLLDEPVSPLRPRAVLFDLDGTITDPAAGMMRCLTYAFESNGLDVPTREDMLLAIGPPWDVHLPTLGVPDDLLADVLSAYRSQYSNGGEFEATVYDGMPELLGALVAKGVEVALATSKPTPSALRIIDHFELTHHFTFIGGATLDRTRSHKADVVAHVLDELGHRDAVMVGDRLYDIVGARAHGLRCIGVRWGHSAPGELEAHEPHAIVDHPAALAALLIG